MKEVKCTNATTIEKEVIDKIEKELNYQFPEDFVNYIMKNSGGYPEVSCIDIDGDTEGINNFLDFVEGEYNYIVEIYKAHEEFASFNCIPFARDACGNYFCFRCSDNSIVFFVHDDVEAIHVCDCFFDFLDALYNEDEVMLEIGGN